MFYYPFATSAVAKVAEHLKDTGWQQQQIKINDPWMGSIVRSILNKDSKSIYRLRRSSFVYQKYLQNLGIRRLSKPWNLRSKPSALQVDWSIFSGHPSKSCTRVISRPFTATLLLKTILLWSHLPRLPVIAKILI